VPDLPPPAESFTVGGERSVRRLGFGAMRLPTGPRTDRAAAVALVRRAVELGVNLIDTAHMYGAGANEELLAEALHPYPADLLVATKVGIDVCGPPGWWAVCGRPEFLRAQVEQGLRRLRLERIDLLQLHRVDPEVPLGDQLGALRELQLAGKVGHVGLSEVTAEQLDQALGLIEVASVQNRYSMVDREHEPVLRRCADLGIAFLPWRPIAAPDPARAGPATAVADELGATVAQVSLAWLLHHSPVLLPIPGTANRAHLEQNVAAGRLRLSAAQLDTLDAGPGQPGAASGAGG
jgi:pyridoxine 4-dehydrogenase